MTIDEVTLDGPKIFAGFNVIFWFGRLRLFLFALKFSTETLTPHGLLPPWIVSPWQFRCIFCQKKYKFSFSQSYQDFFRIKSSGINFWRFHVFQFFKVCYQNISFPHSPLRSMHVPGIFPVRLPCQIDDVLLDLLLNSDSFRPLPETEWSVISMILRIVFHKECFRLPRGLGHFADRNSIPWNQPTNFHPINMVAVLLMFLLGLCVPLFQQDHFVSDRWSFDVQWFQDNSSQASPHSMKIVCVNDFFFSDASRNFRKLFSVSWDAFCFTRLRLNPLSGKILHHDSVPLILPRFTFLFEDFVICCYQVTKFFSTRYGFAIASSASAGLISLLLSMRIDAPESNANSRSSGDFEMGAGIAWILKGDPRDGPFLSRIVIWCKVSREIFTVCLVPNCPSFHRKEKIG